MYVGSRLKRAWKSGRRHLKSLPSSRTGENPPYGMIGGAEETSASFEARSAPRSYPTGLGYGLGLFDFFTQHFKFQPFVLCLLQILLRFRKCIRGLIEFLAIFLVEIGIVKVPLLFCDFRLQFGNRLGPCFPRMLFVEIEPALRGARRRASLGALCGLDRGGLYRVALQIRTALRQHVGIAAGIFDPAAVALRRDHRGHHAVEKIAVMADQDHGAVVVAEHFLEHIEG